MFKAIQLLFSKSRNSGPKPIDTTAKDSEKPIEDYFAEELERCLYIKPECRQIVLGHMLHKKSITKTGNNLTAEEKKSLGLNARLAITKELVQVLSREGLLLENPKVQLEEMYYRATLSKSRIDSFEKALRLGIKTFKLHGSGDGSECAWCKENSGRDFGEDILQKMQANCTCTPYSKCFINPVIDF